MGDEQVLYAIGFLDAEKLKYVRIVNEDLIVLDFKGQASIFADLNDAWEHAEKLGNIYGIEFHVFNV